MPRTTTRKSAPVRRAAAAGEPTHDTEAADETEQTIVPAAFEHMPDDVLSVAMDAYTASTDSGIAQQHAVTNGVVAAKAWAAANGRPYRV